MWFDIENFTSICTRFFHFMFMPLARVAKGSLFLFSFATTNLSYRDKCLMRGIVNAEWQLATTILAANVRYPKIFRGKIDV
jgi:hypothetical protein